MGSETEDGSREDSSKNREAGGQPLADLACQKNDQGEEGKSTRETGKNEIRGASLTLVEQVSMFPQNTEARPEAGH